MAMLNEPRTECTHGVSGLGAQSAYFVSTLRARLFQIQHIGTMDNSMTPPRILIAGVGNIFFGDDAFGVEVAQQLLRDAWPDNVRVVDFGIRGLDLTYALIDTCDIAILIDAAQRGHAPGTLSLILPDIPDSASTEPSASDLLLDPHGMDPAKVLRLVHTMGGQLRHVVLLACEPTPMPEEEMEMQLSEPVLAAIPFAVERIRELVAQILRGEFEPFAKGAST